MDRASARISDALPVEAAVLGAAVQEAVRAATAHDEPVTAIDAAVGLLHEAVNGVFPSVFILEHGRLWLVAQRGYAGLPDGVGVDRGVMGRAVRLGRGQFVPDVRSDPDYVEGLPAVRTEVAVPLRAGRVVVGAFNLEAERPLPDGAIDLVRPLAAKLAPLAASLRASTTLDLSALARLFVYLGSLRDSGEIAALTLASLARVLRVEASQAWLWDDLGAPTELASWRRDESDRAPLSVDELDAIRALVDPSAVCQLVDNRALGEKGEDGVLVWLPLRANGEELGVLVGSGLVGESVDPSQLDVAAVLAAHAAASLDAALSLRRERQSAVTDALTGILNRRGLEECLDRAVGNAQDRRNPLSVLVLDCDDFKEINDRAGHEFGDTLLREVADVLSRGVPEDSQVARLGGDEFVVLLPGAGADVAEELGARIRSLLAAGLTDAGFPLRISGGISTYPFDGGTPSMLLRAADQALYVAKNQGKDRVASFRQLLSRDDPGASAATGAAADAQRRGARSDGAVLTDALAAARAIEAEETVDDVLSRLCKALVFIVGATACSASRVVGGYLVDATEHALREVWLGAEAAYRISDFPLTAETLRTGEPRAISFAEGEVDVAEAFILRELNMSAMLMVPLRVRGRPWGLIELYEMRIRRFTDDDASLAQFLGTHAERRLEALGASEAPRRRPPVYELPPETDELSR